MLAKLLIYSILEVDALRLVLRMNLSEDNFIRFKHVLVSGIDGLKLILLFQSQDIYALYYASNMWIFYDHNIDNLHAQTGFKVGFGLWPVIK